MRRVRVIGAALALALPAACRDEVATVQPEVPAVLTSTAALSQSSRSDGEDHNRKIEIRDSCDPRDPAWAPTGGCLLRDGDVTNAEFGAFLRSPLTIPPNAYLIGHPAWRNEPSYLSIESGRSVRVSNAGGRVHTFTEVAQFGGGRVPQLNIGLTPAPECATARDVAPGQGVELLLSDGLHRFECCIHPWMRAAVRVGPER